MFKHTNKVILAVDIGGSHISSALIGTNQNDLIEGSFANCPIRSNETSNAIFAQWGACIEQSLTKLNGNELVGVGVAAPGPFDYTKGVCLMDDVNKYDALFGINIREALLNQIDVPEVPVLFENDAACFALGESINGCAAGCRKIIGLTLGTGLGACFIDDKRIIKDKKGVPPGGYIYNLPFKNGIAEDFISSRWITGSFEAITGEKLSVKEIAEKAGAHDDVVALSLFAMFGDNLGEILAHCLKSFPADCIVIGGGIAHAADLFLPSFHKRLKTLLGPAVTVKISEKMELSALCGAAGLFEIAEENMKNKHKSEWRKTSQELLPAHLNPNKQQVDEYDLYPFTGLGEGRIFSGYESLAEWMTEHKIMVIDGMHGNSWEKIRTALGQCFRRSGKKVLWYEMDAFLKSELQIQKLVDPYLGEQDSVWGTKTDLSLEDFYDIRKLRKIDIPATGFDMVIMIGTGAALCDWDGPVVYIDLPKNEIQYRLRAGLGNNIGATEQEWVSVYKRLYFVDWVVLKEHRKKIKDRIRVVADAQWYDSINWTLKTPLIQGLKKLSQSPIRVRPWFEAGAWGGQWMKNHIPGLNKDEINYAWSFELITPENGLVFESDGNLLEIAFDWLMEGFSHEVLGKHSGRFGDEFPIRFDFLDTFEGGNLSIQCHPSVSYIQKNFGEKITQDETYYILDCKKGAGVYLGFQEDIKPSRFKAALEDSVNRNKPVDVEEYVQWLPSHKHDFFLIPNQTIHSSGVDNLVLEISATPYIFTFKMYDWVRPDLNGNPRPINIEHAFHNLNFDRKGRRVQQELVSHPMVIEEKENYRLVHLPTHTDHFYDVHRIEFLEEAAIKTNDRCHVLMLVEGESVIVRTGNGAEKQFNYAETFIIPAAAEQYRLINHSGKPVKVVKAFVK